MSKADMTSPGEQLCAAYNAIQCQGHRSNEKDLV